MLFDLFRGIGYLGRGMRRLRQPGIRRYAIVPIAISGSLFSGFIVSAYLGFEWLMGQFLPQGYEWLQWLLWPLFAISILLILIYGFALVANLAASPFNGALANAVERSETGDVTRAGGIGIIGDSLAALGTELKRIGHYLIRAIPLLLLFLIPGINLIAPALWLLFSAWVLASEYASPSLDNHGISFKAQRQMLRRRPLMVLGFGGVTLFASMVPILNFFVMPAAVAGATLMHLEHFRTQTR